MLQTLQNELNNIQTKGKQQDLKLENLYLSFNEIYHLQNNLNNPTTTNHNMLNKVRPEVFHQILIFLDNKQIQQFRLVSGRGNNVVKLMLPKQIKIFKQLIADQQDEIQLKIQIAEEMAKDQNQQKILKAAFDEISKIHKNQIVEVRSFARPPQLVGKIINLFCITLDPTFLENDNWQDCKNFLGRLNFLELIYNLDISSISDKQVQQLEQVNSISVQQAEVVSLVSSSLLIFLKAVLEIRQSKLYMTKNAIKQLENKIKKEEQLIQNLEKIIKRE